MWPKRDAVEVRAVAAAAALLTGGSDGSGEEPARQRAAWLALAARAGGLENEFSPPPSSEKGGGGGARAVWGCVKAMAAAMTGGAGFAGAAETRKEVCREGGGRWSCRVCRFFVFLAVKTFCFPSLLFALAHGQAAG